MPALSDKLKKMREEHLMVGNQIRRKEGEVFNAPSGYDLEAVYESRRENGEWVEFYRGEWREGSREGRGTSVRQWENGDQRVYEGQWEKDSYDGYGAWIFSKGYSYRGQWKKGVKQGWGEQIDKEGNRYRGQYREGNKEGWGE